MIDLFAADATWTRAIAALGADIVIKATILAGAALVLHWLFGARRALTRSALWNTCLIALLALPIVTAAFPRLRIDCLPARPESVEPRAEGNGRLPLAAMAWPEQARPIDSPIGEMRASVHETSTPSAALPPPAPRQETDVSLPLVPVPELIRVASADAEPTHRAGNPISPRGVNWPLVVITVYCLIAMLLTVRLIGSLVAVRRLRRLAVAVDDPEWTEVLDRWRRRLGIRRPVSLGASPGVRVPVVLGWLRPAVLLPHSMSDPGGGHHRHAVLLHELAHVRRGDYAWNLMLRIVQALYWFHPLTWLIGRLVRSVREQACDELCVHHLRGTASYRETLVAVAAALVDRPTPAMGVGMARSSRIAGRLRRIDSGRRAARCLARRPVRVATAAVALIAVMLLGPLELGRRAAVGQELEAQDRPKSSPSRSETESDTKLTQPDYSPGSAAGLKAGQPAPPFSIKTLDGKPLRLADFRGKYVLLDFWATWCGRCVGQTPALKKLNERFGGDERFVLVSLSLDKSAEAAEKFVKRNGLSWTHGFLDDRNRTKIRNAYDVFAIPALFLIDPEGKLIATDLDGPTAAERALSRLLVVDDRAKPAAAPSKKTGDDDGVSPEDKSVRTTLTGRVVDYNRSPIEGATVQWWSNRFRAPVTTDAQGRYRIENLRAIHYEKKAHTMLWARADGYNAQFLEIEVGADMKPVSFRLGAGRTIRGRLIDETGRPVAGAWVRSGPGVMRSADWFERHHVLKWNTKTDADGRFTWEHAPYEDVRISCGKDGYLWGVGINIPLFRADNVILMPHALEISGRVHDADSDEPISSFTVDVFMGQDAVERRRPSETMQFDNGTFRMTFDGLSDQYSFRISADGHAPADSPVYWRTDGKQGFDAKLRRAQGPTGVVKTTEDTPAVGAEVLLYVFGDPPKGLEFVNGKIDDAEHRGHGGAEPIRAETDLDGRFRFPVQVEPYILVVMHDAGYAEATDEDLAETTEIVLRPWARITGTARRGSEPVTDEFVAAYFASRRGDPILIFHRCEVMPDAAGRFTLNRVPPGDGQFGISAPRGRYRGFRSRLNVAVAPGEVRTIDIGGGGRPVVVRLRAPEGFDRAVGWGSGYPGLHPEAAEVPAEVRQQGTEAAGRWRESWLETAEGRAYRQRPSYYLYHEGAGEYRAEDVTAGTYVLSASLYESGVFSRGTRLSIRETVKVPDPPGGDGDPTLDLGSFTLQAIEPGPRPKPLQVGADAAPFSIKTLDDKPLRLADHRGKYVLLDFWATWCGPCVRQTPALKRLFDRFGGDDRFVMIGLSLDKRTEDPRRYVQENRLGWVQGFLGDWAKTDIPARYGVSGIPTLILIDPDGKIVAAGLNAASARRRLDGLLSDAPPARSSGVERKRTLLNRRRRSQYRLPDRVWAPQDRPMFTARNIHLLGAIRRT